MALRPGDRLGRYEILAPLGGGGMGEVFRARDDRLDREVAIKVLPEAVAQDPERLSRFSREAKAVASLSHPNILEIYDFASEGELDYAVTELLEGQTLRERIDKGKNDWQSAVRICAAIADGLAAAHKGQIIHRDLKPENVVVTGDSQVKILDFGLAKVLHPDAESEVGSESPTGTMDTRVGAVMGTVGYMSPEQVRGEIVDHRTDIFSLGCLLHELIAGRRAFSGNSQEEVGAAILDRQAATLERTNRHLPEGVQIIVDRCLEKLPANRFQNAGDLAFALRSLATGSGSEAAESGSQRSRWLLPAAVAAILIAVTVGLVLLRDRREAGPPHAAADELKPNLAAVAPFENRTGNTELDDLGLVVADWLTNTLARIDAVDVVPIGMGAELRAGFTSPREIADATGAGIVVTGAYYLDGETLSFQANLTDAIEGSLLRSLDPAAGLVDRPMDGVKALGDEVAGAVASLFSQWDREFDQSFQPPSYEAYREYVAGLEFFAVDNRKAFEHWNRAVEIDPDFVAPQLMMVSLLRVAGSYDRAQEVVDRLADQRQRMNPFERVLLEYQSATLAGDSQRALSQMRRNFEQAPRSTLVTFGLTRNLLLCARPHEALEVISGVSDLGAWAGAGTCGFLFDVKMIAEHVLGMYDAELTTASQGIDTCGNRVSFQIARARALIGRGEIDLVEDTLNDGLQASDARRYSVRLFWAVARELDAHGHHAPALEMAQRGVDHARDHISADEASEWQQIRCAQMQAMLGQLEKADRILLALNEEIPDDDDIVGWLGIIAAAKGDLPRAMACSTQLREMEKPPALAGWIGFYRASISAHLGQTDEALGLLRKSFAEGFPWSEDLHAKLELKPLRGHPEFEAILHPEE